MSRVKLNWKPVRIEKKLKTLQVAIRQTKDNTPVAKLRLHAKIDRWMAQIEEIQRRIHSINRELLPKLEEVLDLKIKNVELLVVSMFQPSTKNLFLELDVHFKSEGWDPLGNHGFTELIALSEIAQVIALLGDAAIAMGVLYQLWKPDPTDVGKLTQIKSEIVSNEHMAKLCDKWGLYEHRIHFDVGTQSKAEIEHDKGTLVETIFGIIQMEYGFPKVMSNIKHLL